MRSPIARRRMWRGPGVLLLAMAWVLILPAGSVRAQSFTLEEVMRFSFPNGLTVSDSGDRLAWLANEEGRRNVWGSEAPQWEPRLLTTYLDDDGQSLSGLAFVPGSSHLIYLRGSSENRAGELSNPTSDPAGVSRDLWLVAWNGGEPRRLAGAVSPHLSPVDRIVIWSAGGRCYRLDLAPVIDRGAAPEAEVLFAVRRSLNDPVFSPDGTRIAFSSARDGRSILGVYDIPSGTLSWLTNGVDSDFWPRWSRDGSRLAFIREPVEHPGFAVAVVEVGTAVTLELWRSPADGTGYYPGAIAGSYELMYGDGWLVFAGEWTGWNHLYALPDTGGQITDLTPGEGIVENAVLTPDGREVIVSANFTSIDHRQLGRIRLADGRTEWIVDGEEIAWEPVPFTTSTGADQLAFIRSDARSPAGVWLQEDGRRPRRISALADDFPAAELVVPEQVIFTAADGWTIHGQLFVPRNLRRRQQAPAVIFMHGGSRRQMLLGWHNRGYYHTAYGFNQYLAANGYVVLSVNYRSGIGYGVDFREPDDYGWRGASEYQDIVAAARFLQEHPRVDPDRIGLWGGSYGGYLTALGLARDSDLFTAGVDLHGVHNWADQLAWWARGEISAPNEAMRDSIAAVAYRASPVADIAGWRSPVLIVHGDDDRNVPFEASIDLVRRLRRKGDVIFHELYFPDEAHGFLLHRNWLEVFRQATDFFDRYLKTGGDG